MRWFLLALLGIAIAAGVSVAASRLASQQIGLASQPISAGDALAPARQKPQPNQPPRHPHGGNDRTAPVPATPPARTETSEPEPTSPTLAPPVEPHSGTGHDGESGGGAAADD
jgi:hypothetical protein